jgi:hypothetical protein
VSVTGNRPILINSKEGMAMKLKVIEIIETDREGNQKQNETVFHTYGQAVFYIKQRMKGIIKQDTLKHFRKNGQKITAENLNQFCNDEFKFWLGESDDNQFLYVAGCLGWSCSWDIKAV